ncbi:hypothetical protein [Enterocloster clostridioformis]|uniref:hypothetical protein n=1 Tax=Enterocloster clostridioformis TaxID=1531 RepID=UPI0032C009C4
MLAGKAGDDYVPSQGNVREGKGSRARNVSQVEDSARSLDIPMSREDFLRMKKDADKVIWPNRVAIQKTGCPEQLK